MLCVWEVVVWRGWAAGLRGGRQSAGGGGGVGVRGEGEAECDFTCNLTTAPPPTGNIAGPSSQADLGKQRTRGLSESRSLAVHSGASTQTYLSWKGQGAGGGE